MLGSVHVDVGDSGLQHRHVRCRLFGRLSGEEGGTCGRHEGVAGELPMVAIETRPPVETSPIAMLESLEQCPCIDAENRCGFGRQTVRGVHDGRRSCRYGLRHGLEYQLTKAVESDVGKHAPGVAEVCGRAGGWKTLGRAHSCDFIRERLKLCAAWVLAEGTKALCDSGHRVGSGDVMFRGYHVRHAGCTRCGEGRQNAGSEMGLMTR